MAQSLIPSGLVFFCFGLKRVAEISRISEARGKWRGGERERWGKEREREEQVRSGENPRYDPVRPTREKERKKKDMQVPTMWSGIYSYIQALSTYPKGDRGRGWGKIGLANTRG